MRSLARIAAATLCLMAGCAEQEDRPAVPPYKSTASQMVDNGLAAFPRLVDRPETEETQALGHGRLVVEAGCLRLVTADGSRLIVWPSAATPFPDGRGVGDRSSGTAIWVGEEIVIPGGETNGFDPSALDDRVPARCRGPYWIAGRGFFKAPEAGWSTRRLSSPVSVSLPADMIQLPVQTIDSLVDVFQSPALKLVFDYGRYGCGASGGDGTSGHAVSQIYVDERPLRMDRYAETSQDGGRRLFRLDARMPGLDLARRSAPSAASQTCLAISAHCLTSRACDIARSILSTIRIGPATREEAIAVALANYPELERYRTTDLPPHSIEAVRERSGGWLLGFIRSGSGLPGILDAQCLRVSRFGEVEQVGMFRRPPNAIVRRLDLASCRPANP
jgi:hypothetical protein